MLDAVRDEERVETDAADPVVHGRPLADEPGLGALTLPGFIREVCTRFAGNEACVMHEGGAVTRWSYADLWEQAVRVARALRAAGCGKDMRVGVMMTNRPEWLAATFGAGLAGGVAVTLSTFSTRAELEYLLQASRISVLLFESRVLKKDFAVMLAELEPAIARPAPGGLVSPTYPFLRRLACVGEPPEGGAIEGWEAFLGTGEAIPPEVIDATAQAAMPHEAGAILFSSGSTAQPKGIVNTHRGMCIHFWRWARYFGLEEDTRAWAPNGFFWSGNFATVLGCTLAAGGCLVLQSTFEPEASLRLMEAERVNYPTVWPHQGAQLVEAANWATTDLSAMRYVAKGTELGSHPTIVTDWKEPRCSYGNTETFTVSTCYPNSSPENVLGRSHGEVLAGMALKIVDPATGAALPRGERGEIAVKGVTLMLGYLGIDPAETFDADGFLRTGDGGWINERAELMWEGRLSDIIKTGGANVSPVEIDLLIAKYPGVKVVRTVGVPHDTLGEIVVACIVPEEGAALDAEAVRAFARGSLASYKVPRRILFVDEGELTLTGTNKIRTADLRVLAARRLSDEAG